MHRVPSRLIEAGWNKHSLTIEDFDRVCAECDPPLLVYSAEMEPPGMYFERRGRSIIVPNSALQGVALAIVAWHEFGHYLLHAPGLRFFIQGTATKFEKEADTFAAVALIPRFMIEYSTNGELQDDYAFPSDLLNFRRRIYEERGI